MGLIPPAYMCVYVQYILTILNYYKKKLGSSAAIFKHSYSNQAPKYLFSTMLHYDILVVVYLFAIARALLHGQKFVLRCIIGHVLSLATA
jgi:hypothetical protein